jgi:hypothetical protein
MQEDTRVHQMGRKLVFLSLAAALRSGEFHGGHAPKSATTQESLLQIATTMGSFGSRGHGCSTLGQHNLDKEFQSLHKECPDTDEAPKSQHTIPNNSAI